MRECGGCSSWFKGLGRQEHSEACKARFRELLKDEQKMRNYEERLKEFEAREKAKRQRKFRRCALLSLSVGMVALALILLQRRCKGA